MIPTTSLRQPCISRAAAARLTRNAIAAACSALALAAGGTTLGAQRPIPAPNDSSIIYVAGPGGALVRRDLRTRLERDISPWPLDVTGHAPADMKYRFGAEFPIAFSPHDAKTIFVGANVVLKTTSEGQSWTPVSGDLTRADRHSLLLSAGPAALRRAAIGPNAVLSALAESPRLAGIIWTGSADGRVSLTLDFGRSWTDVTPPDLPAGSRIAGVHPSPDDARSADIVVATSAGAPARLRLRTHDHGRSWARVEETNVVAAAAAVDARSAAAAPAPAEPTPLDLKEQSMLLRKIRDRADETNAMVRTIHELQRQIAERRAALGAPRPGVEVLALALGESLTMVEDSLHRHVAGDADERARPARLAEQWEGLARAVATGRARPTDQAYAVFTTLSIRLDQERATLRRILDTLVPRLDAALREAGSPEVVVSWRSER